eukprot:TRINITY_DN989_c0_g1_i1.p1 TRINITY_DN989_c0_g1~~TRINITY_DN989_c0_g1_i1.p1  ORF type:complete len:292 (-),score=65.92 TRINITY_DN989_c0_g1_i1:209-1084(-)
MQISLYCVVSRWSFFVHFKRTFQFLELLGVYRKTCSRLRPSHTALEIESIIRKVHPIKVEGIAYFESEKRNEVSDVIGFYNEIFLKEMFSYVKDNFAIPSSDSKSSASLDTPLSPLFKMSAISHKRRIDVTISPKSTPRMSRERKTFFVFGDRKRPRPLLESGIASVEESGSGYDGGMMGHPRSRKVVDSRRNLLRPFRRPPEPIGASTARAIPAIDVSSRDPAFETSQQVGYDPLAIPSSRGSDGSDSGDSPSSSSPTVRRPPLAPTPIRPVPMTPPASPNKWDLKKKMM